MRVLKTIRIDNKLWEEFTSTAHKVYRKHGCVTMAIEDAVRRWLDEHR